MPSTEALSATGVAQVINAVQQGGAQLITVMPQIQEVARLTKPFLQQLRNKIIEAIRQVLIAEKESETFKQIASQVQAIVEQINSGVYQINNAQNLMG